MYRSVFITVFALVTVAGVSGCSLRDVRDYAVDQAVHPRASDLLRDVERTAEEISDEEQAERVEELSAEYDEFLRENSRDPDKESDEERSILAVDPDGRY